MTCRPVVGAEPLEQIPAGALDGREHVVAARRLAGRRPAARRTTRPASTWRNVSRACVEDLVCDGRGTAAAARAPPRSPRARSRTRRSRSCRCPSPRRPGCGGGRAPRARRASLSRIASWNGYGAQRDERQARLAIAAASPPQRRAEPRALQHHRPGRRPRTRVAATTSRTCPRTSRCTCGRSAAHTFTIHSCPPRARSR